MSEKFNLATLSKEELAKQLRKPSGAGGKEVGEQMNIGNKTICLNSYKVLNPKPHSLVLEIGMGNGYFIKDLLAIEATLNYIGLDFSQTMIDEATRLNQEYIHLEKVSFVNGSIENLPFDNNSIEYITTTNTVYFWPNLPENLKELYRVLKPNGKVLIAYRPKEVMDKIELSKYGFTKYTKQEIEQSLCLGGFQEIETETILEPTQELNGKSLKMQGVYSIGIKKS